MPAYIKYRQGVVSKPTSSSVKNTPLSSKEIDGNLHSIEDAISNIESDSWVSTNRIGESQVTPSKLSTDSVGFKNKIGIQTDTTGSTIIAKGTTADRDSNPIEGYFRYNITLGKPEWRNATTWISASGNSDIVYIGNTPVALNRANSTLALTGVSIDGNAGTVTNGVYTTGSYANPAWITEINGSKITNLSIQTGKYADSSITTQKTAFTTQNQFDSSTKPATTEFVQQALGNIKNGAIYVGSSSYTMTTYMVGSAFYFVSDANNFYLPPDMSSIPAGATVYLSANVPVTIWGGLGLIDDRSNGGKGFIYLDRQEDIFLLWTGTMWLAIGGSYIIRSSSRTTPASMFGSRVSQNGYQKLPSGLIIQWGKTPGGNGIYTYSFPIAFPNACFSILSQTGNAVPSDNDNITNGTEPISNSQFNITLDYNRSCFWIAIGC